MSYVPIEDLDFFKDLVGISDEIWIEVVEWNGFAQRTVGEQLVRALDSIAANIAEGDGRQSDLDSLRFFSIAKASAREARFWLVRASERKLVATERGATFVLRLESVMRRLNALIRRRRNILEVKEQPAEYRVDEGDPWSDECLRP